ncbi:acyl carrier protein [Cellulomonas hominis]|uniref:Acyl carrier protein n=1 Tax=Cellulomonas hominis TaxID=156981 RepID=A0A511FK05_9CELL|nr:acyl carrier protein [Cellulomonas hominis]MBB5475096.1 acyl carrier protein [Cellulomonas hominis]NKY07486.1 acyl carrier protein [Cellulomonas hominis]GEL48904.1 acyl carrier protein [Cellulomonas hominis]
MPSTQDQVHDVIRDVLLQPDLQLTDTTTAGDVEGWDSLAHISILFSLESAFGIRFADTEMGSIQNVGELVRLIEAKTSA